MSPEHTNDVHRKKPATSQNLNPGFRFSLPEAQEEQPRSLEDVGVLETNSPGEQPPHALHAAELVPIEKEPACA